MGSDEVTDAWMDAVVALQGGKTFAEVAGVVEDPPPGMRLVVSGGADGADLLWTEAMLSRGHHAVITSFRGHARTLPSLRNMSRCRVVELDATTMDEASDLVQLTARYLGKNAPKREPTRSLIHRSAYQVSHVRAVVVIGTLNGDVAGIGVDGGTGWTCQMFAIRMVSEIGQDRGDFLIPLFVYSDGHWHQARIRIRDGEFKRVQWQQTKATNVSKHISTGSFAGIGSRNVDRESTKRVIAEVLC